MRSAASRWGAVALCAALGVCLSACPKPVGSEYLRWASMPYSGAPMDTLGEGDRFELRVYQEPDMSGEYLVSAPGLIQFPLIGEVVVIGRGCGAIEAEIADRLADGYIRNPSVSCQVLEVNSLAIVVSGEVGAPGVFPYTPELTVVEAIALAQGLTPNAANDRVIVTRVVEETTHDIVVPFQQIVNGRAPNFRLWPSDSIFVPSFRLLP